MSKTRGKRGTRSFAAAAMRMSAESSEWERIALEAESRAAEAERAQAVLAGRLEAARAARATDEAERDALARSIDLSSAEGVLRTVQAFYPERVEVCPEAYASAREYRMTDAATAWRIALSAATDIWPLAFEGTAGRLADDYAARTGFELSWHEGSQTSRNPRLRAMRSIRRDGRELDMSAHVKGRGRDRLRMHFCADPRTRRIVIGHFGTHLETAGSARRGYKR